MKYLFLTILSMLAICANAQDAKTDGKQKGYFNITELCIYFGKASREMEEPKPGTPSYFKGNSTMTTARTINGGFLTMAGLLHIATIK